MIYVVTYFEVRPDRADAAMVFIRQYVKDSQGEEGCGGVEIVQELHRRNRIVVIESWQAESAFKAHESAAHVANFRSKVAEIHKSPFDQRVHNDFAVGSKSTPLSRSELFAVTHVDVPPPRKDETEALLKATAEKIRAQAGNMRLDVFQQTARPNHFTMVAVWKDEAAFAAHETHPDTRQFREALGPMLGALYDERLYKGLE
jgi:quinol monooxygenase YgiN